MEELALLLKRKREDLGFRLLPVLYGINYEQCTSLPEGYHSDKWVVEGDKPAQEVLQEWAAGVKALLHVTAIREDQVLYQLQLHKIW